MNERDELMRDKAEPTGARDWIEKNRDLFWDVMRTFLGFALLVKGAHYFRNQEELIMMMKTASVPFASTALAETVAVVHVVGGLLLAFGLFTRIAALVQIPVVAGAAIFVHFREGLMTQVPGLELSVMVTFLLTLLTIAGSGRWSTDWYFMEHKRQPAEPIATH